MRTEFSLEIGVDVTCSPISVPRRILKQAEAGVPVKELCRRHGFSDASFYTWRAKFGGMTVADAKRLKDLELENSRLKKLLAEAHLDIESLKVVARGKG